MGAWQEDIILAQIADRIAIGSYSRSYCTDSEQSQTLVFHQHTMQTTCLLLKSWFLIG